MAWDGMGAFVRALEERSELRAHPAPGRPPPRGLCDRRPRDEGRRPGAPLRERRRRLASRSSSTPTARGCACRWPSGSRTWKSTLAPSPSWCTRQAPSSARAAGRSSPSSSPSSPTSRRARSRRAAVRTSCEPATTSISTRSRSSRAGRRTAAPSSRCRRSSRATPRPASATSAATGCRSSTVARTAMHWQIHKTGARHFRRAQRAGPAAPRGRRGPRRRSRRSTYAATAPLPDGIDEWMFAGFLRKRAVATVALQDGRSRGPGRRRLRARGVRRPAGEPWSTKGPFGDHTGYYTPGRPLPALPRHRAHAPRPTPSTPRRSSARRRWRTRGWARPPSGCSCRCCGCSSPRSWT